MNNLNEKIRNHIKLPLSNVEEKIKEALKTDYIFEIDGNIMDQRLQSMFRNSVTWVIYDTTSYVRLGVRGSSFAL